MINWVRLKKVGLVGFGAYLPYERISVREIAQAHGRNGEEIEKSLGLVTKTVARRDEDVNSMGIEAARVAIRRAGIKPRQLGSIFVGSESHPYAVKPTGVMIGEVLGVGREYFCADLEFACKAGTAAIQLVAAQVEAGLVEYGLALGADKAQARPGDVLEYSAGAGAAAFILGPVEKSVARLVMTGSCASDTPDFWRRAGATYPSHTGRFTGEPGYFRHLEMSLKKFFKASGRRPKEFDAVVFHMPNAKFPQKLAKRVGVKPAQLELAFLVPQIGNLYAACSLVGLVAVLEEVGPNKNVLLASYGSGAGSDILWFQTTALLSDTKFGKSRIKDYLVHNQEIGYLDYLRHQEAL
ncbi:hydroxymethylglutaryl-CoA synthase [Patescibacteria group bacterium]|nr:hydroxymethylglutaryl-CoA synthase [Patescibacteria group bacterium]